MRGMTFAKVTPRMIVLLTHQKRMGGGKDSPGALVLKKLHGFLKEIPRN